MVADILRICRAEELMAPILMFLEKGYQVSVYSMKGGRIPIDQGSMSDQFRTEDVDKFLSQGAQVLQLIEYVPEYISSAFIVD
jgi:hypothetical protein